MKPKVEESEVKAQPVGLSSNQEETITRTSLDTATKAVNPSANVDGSLLYHHHYHHNNEESSLTFQKSFFSDVATVSQQTAEKTKTVHHIHLHHDDNEATRTTVTSNPSLRRRRRVGHNDATTRTNDKWSKLENLKMLYNEGRWRPVCSLELVKVLEVEQILQSCGCSVEFVEVVL